MKRIHPHFSKISRQYKDLRTTDVEPILYIKRRLQHLNKIEGADVGCGVGRYVVKLFHLMGQKLHLACIDHNWRMLNELTKNLRNHKVKNFKTLNASAAALPLANNSLDTIVTFNAIHHFDLSDFLEEVARVLRNHGYLFIYTRLRSQNRRNIWGRFFPEFHEKENRLYDMGELETVLKKIPTLQLESTEYFKYKRSATLKWLTTQATNHHYSTFYLYNETEFQKALRKFQEDITHHFRNPRDIFWNDENTMLNVRKNIR